MICGQPVQIESLADSTQRPRLEMNAEGPTVYLPSIMNRFSSKDRNIRGYTVTLAHEVGHVEFGTYRIDLPFLRILAQRVAERYQLETNISAIGSLTDFFDLYPQKGVIRDLWTILEDARVDFLLQQEYPGLRNDLAAVSRASVQTRSLLHGMTAREMVLDQLLLRFTQGADNPPVQDNLQQVVDRSWDVAQVIRDPDATNEHAVELADGIYQVLDEMIGRLEAVVPHDADPPAEEEELGAGPRAAEETGGGYRGITNWAYRGEMNPDYVRGESTESDEGGDVEEQPEPELANAGRAFSLSRTSNRRTGRAGSPAGRRRRSGVAAVRPGRLFPRERCGRWTVAGAVRSGTGVRVSGMGRRHPGLPAQMVPGGRASRRRK